MPWSASARALFAITPLQLQPPRRELERLCPAAPLADPKRARTARVSERGREGNSYPSAASLCRQDSFPSERPRGVGCRPSPLTKAAIFPACPVNVGNLRETGHTAGPAPPAAPADERTSAFRPLQPFDQMAALGGNTPVSRHSTTTSSRTAAFQSGERRLSTHSCRSRSRRGHFASFLDLGVTY